MQAAWLFQFQQQFTPRQQGGQQNHQSQGATAADAAAAAPLQLKRCSIAPETVSPLTADSPTGAAPSHLPDISTRASDQVPLIKQLQTTLWILQDAACSCASGAGTHDLIYDLQRSDSVLPGCTVSQVVENAEQDAHLPLRWHRCSLAAVNVQPTHASFASHSASHVSAVPAAITCMSWVTSHASGTRMLCSAASDTKLLRMARQMSAYVGRSLH